jgi:hypothetical protein
MVLVVDRPERLKETLPDLIVPLTRLAELVRCEIIPSLWITSWGADENILCHLVTSRYYDCVRL